MKTKLLTLFMTVWCSYTEAQVVNGGFETWSNGNPTDWFTSNITGIATPITQATPAHSGSFAAKGQAVLFMNSTIAPVLSSSPPGIGFPVSTLSSQLNFWYKTNLVNGDVFTIGVVIFDGSSNTLAIGTLDITANSTSFSQATCPIQFVQGGVPYSCIITATIADMNGNEPSLNSYFIVDDFSLSGSLSIDNHQSSESVIKVFPSPAKDLITVHFNNSISSSDAFAIYNLLGKKVLDIDLLAASFPEQKISVDVRTIDNGLYFIRSEKSSSYSVPFVVSH